MATTSAQIIRRTFAPAALVGQVYAREHGDTGAPMPIGNVLALELSHKEDVQKQPDMTALGGGTHAEMRRVTEVELSMTLADINVTNLARATLGTTRGVEGGTVPAEAHTVTLGGLLRTAHLGPKNVVLAKTGGSSTGTVTDEEHLDVSKGDLVTLAHADASSVVVRIGTSLATATTLTASGNYTVVSAGVQVDVAAPDVTDGAGLWISYEYPVAGTVVPASGNYEVRASGVYVLPDATDLAADDAVTVGYEYGSYAVIEALTTKARELELVFEGLNEADDGKPAVIEIWRASQGVSSSIALLADNKFMNLQVSGAVLKDDGKTGTGVSKYYRVRKT